MILNDRLVAVQYMEETMDISAGSVYLEMSKVSAKKGP